MAKVKYYAKEKTMVSTNRPKVLAFASDIVDREHTVSMPCRFLPCKRLLPITEWYADLQRSLRGGMS